MSRTAADPSVRRSYADASWTPFWLDAPDRPAARPPLEGDLTVDLAIVGAGYTGLWAALQALEERPDRDVVVLEAERVAFGGSGRNGGFCEASLTHGLHNGLDRFPDEIHDLEREGRESYDALIATLDRHAIDCAFEPTGTLVAATEPHEVAWCHEAVADMTPYGYDVTFLDRDQVRAEIDSPTFLAGFWRTDAGAVIDPARLAWGLASAAEALGARIHEGTPVSSIRGRRCDRPARDADRARAGTPGHRRDERVPPARARDPPVRAARLRLRADDRTAHPGSARAT